MRAITKGLFRTKATSTPIVFFIGFDRCLEREFLHYFRFIHNIKLTQRIHAALNEIYYHLSYIPIYGDSTMTVQKILKMGNPILRLIASNFDRDEILSEETKLLLENMWDTLEVAGGIGLAAPQIGVSKQLAIIEISEESERYPEAEASEAFIIFNPKISVVDNDLQGFWEGCLSVPGLRGYVERPKKIQIDYLDEFAEQQSIVLEDFLATVFQHELDHLIGMLYVDRMEDAGTLMFEDEMDLLNEVEDEEILD